MDLEQLLIIAGIIIIILILIFYGWRQGYIKWFINLFRKKVVIKKVPIVPIVPIESEESKPPVIPDYPEGHPDDRSKEESNNNTNVSGFRTRRKRFSLY